jgi:hypothetical protein
MNWVRLGSFGFVFFEWAGVVFSRKHLRQMELHWFCRCENWVRFAKKRPICRGVSTSVEGSLIENAKIKVQNAKLWNPDSVGMGVLVVALFSMLRILYLLDAYCT